MNCGCLTCRVLLNTIVVWRHKLERETLTIMKACEVVGVSRRTIYNWIRSQKIEYVRTAGGSIRIFADTLWRSAKAEAPSANNADCNTSRN